ncbi:MAG: 2-C-methyl-D-erythritol 2,4-cyclodiphosphate synthase [Deltaproteobacteria bacterium]|nr:2-C-methyl-D-erythritol 2,4-cyclodiphosphate synthase [Deltaproteobacteria bacterium]MCL5276537.1 2-C-methyl-D-erythritol 2,4-cyclodiphosphate synthase [Deltaproteobacteria bacterium]
MSRTGIGYDIHRLVEGRRLIIGGIDIPYRKGLLGHSDADVLLHAISDAILGALSRGDIGTHFPPDDDAYKDMPGASILKKAMEIARKDGYDVQNIDAVIIAEEPKLSQYYDRIIDSVAGIAGVPPSSIGIKAKTNEGLDAPGRGEAIAAYAVVLLGK